MLHTILHYALGPGLPVTLAVIVAGFVASIIGTTEVF
jgi:hypothetical protein